MGSAASIPEQFYVAAKKGRADKLAKLVQKHSPDVSWTAPDGTCAVHVAAQSLDAETVRCVVKDLGADAGAVNAVNGDTPTLCAVNAGVKVLRKAGGPQKTRAVVEFLLANGGDARVKNAAGKSAFDIASAAGMHDCMRALEVGTCQTQLDCWCGMIAFKSNTGGGLLSLVGVRTWAQAYATVLYYPAERTMLLSVFQTHHSSGPNFVIALTGGNVQAEDPGILDGVPLFGKKHAFTITNTADGKKYNFAAKDQAEYTTLYHIISATAVLQREATAKAQQAVAEKDAAAAKGVTLTGLVQTAAAALVAGAESAPAVAVVAAPAAVATAAAPVDTAAASAAAAAESDSFWSSAAAAGAAAASVADERPSAAVAVASAPAPAAPVVVPVAPTTSLPLVLPAVPTAAPEAESEPDPLLMEMS